MLEYRRLIEICIIIQMYLGANCYYCDTRCKSCIDARCTSCYQGQGLTLYRNSCFHCPQGCTVCSSDSNCTSCSDGYYLFQNNCYACSKGCKICNSPPSYYYIYFFFDGKYDNCGMCQPGYFITTQSICSSCSQNCTTCRSTIECFSCSDGSYLQRGFCKSCSSNCISCSTLTQCINCRTNYTLTNGFCELVITLNDSFISNGSNNSNKNSTSMAIGIAISVVVVIVAVIIIIYCYFKKKKEKIQESKNSQEKNSSLEPINLENKEGWQSKPEIDQFLYKEACSICLEPQLNVQTHCKHAFHDKCLDGWCKKRGLFPTCPNCRSDLNDIRLICKRCHLKYKQLNWKGLTEIRDFSQLIKTCSSCRQQNPQN